MEYIFILSIFLGLLQIMSFRESLSFIMPQDIYHNTGEIIPRKSHYARL